MPIGAIPCKNQTTGPILMDNLKSDNKCIFCSPVPPQFSKFEIFFFFKMKLSVTQIDSETSRFWEMEFAPPSLLDRNRGSQELKRNRVNAPRHPRAITILRFSLGTVIICNYNKL